MNNKILLVDDDINILYGYQRNLRGKFDIYIATKAQEGLELVQKQGPFAAVISDYRMPEMDGIQFLSLVCQHFPDTVRIMLTGHADINIAIDAINHGCIFRFLTKPCPDNILITHVESAVEYYRLLTSEKEFLDKTLNGSIKVLIDILSIAKPAAFSRAIQISNLSKKLAAKLKYKNLWEVEITSLLSQIGCISVPEEILKKKYSNQPLTIQENDLYNSHPYVGKTILSNIPHLESIAESINYQLHSTPKADNIRELPFTARLLKVVNDFETYIGSGKSNQEALLQMMQDKKLYDPEVFAALETEISGSENSYVLKPMNLKDIKPGMLFAEDLVDQNGQILISKGHEVSDIIQICLKNFNQMEIVQEPIKVLVPTMK